MKVIYAIISSTRTMAVLLIIFAVSIGLATFVENDFGTDAARSIIYNAKWFELLMVLGCINIIAVTIKKKMYRRSKLTLLTFHLAFVVVIIGAGITRYFGTEGSLHVREGHTSDQFLTSKTYVSIKLKRGNDSIIYSKPVLYSNISHNHFDKSFSLDGHTITAQLKLFFEKADEALQPDKNGGPHAHFVAAGQSGRRNLLVKPGDKFMLGTTKVNFLEQPDSAVKPHQVNIFVNQKGSLSFVAPFPVVRTIMATQKTDTLAPGKVHPYLPLSLHNFNGSPLVLKQFMAKSTITAMPNENIKSELPSALMMDVNSGGTTKTMTVFGTKDYAGKPAMADINGTKVWLSYGSVYKKLPFAIHLNDFIIKRYPGSKSPSWFESYVRLIDQKRNINEEKRIYMNNILNYRGYRLYQASYDRDEHGTVLAVNHDGLGTIITYLGYLALAIGFILSLFNKNSRFIYLWRKTSEAGKITKVLIATLVLGSLSARSYSQDTLSTDDTTSNYHEYHDFHHYKLPVINKGLAEDFGKILVQNNGRIEPINTLASEIIRKVVRKETYKNQTPDQVLLGMLVYPQYWQQEPMILVDHPAIDKQLGIQSKYASFIDFFTGASFGDYILRQNVEDAYRKRPAYRTKYDNEVMRADERLNVCYMIYSESAMKIFPDPNDTTYTWYTPEASAGVFNSQDSVFTKHVLDYLFSEIQKSVTTHNWKLPIQLVNSIQKFQYKNGAAVIPSQMHLKAEMFYNKANLFERLMSIYLLIGFILLFIEFLHMFFPGFNMKIFSIPAFIIILLTFLAHAFALILRWYIEGHAPWSNGFEALTYIAWATVLAGLIFYKKSSITLSVTSILAGLILMVALMSWMDPQITTLVPVLNSYWLDIHVSDIITSYGFLGLGALLATVNLLLMFFQNEKNTLQLQPNISQITRIIEMTLIIGLYMLTIGTFLGGVWANESWGRYWGWDPKETWALTTAIVYAIILHLRLIPGMKSKLLFNILALVGFSSVVMTYFGVNYYLSGLHSYAKGEPMPIPPILYYSVVTVIILCTFAAYNQIRLKRSLTATKENDEE